MALIMAGHHRSGTSMLREVCQTHPQVELTREMGNFYRLNIPFPDYRRFMFGRWWIRRNASIRPNSTVQTRHLPTEMPRNLLLVLRYLRYIRQFQRGVVDAQVIDRALHALYRHAAVVGDKLPDYGFHIDELARDPNLECVFIHRDPRDMVASYLVKTRGPWRHFTSDELREPGHVAERWVRQMERMDRCRDRLLVIRYEDFVTNPVHILQQLGQWLNIEPTGFDHTRVHMSSVGKHRQALTEQEIADVVEVAGATMQRNGYLI